MHLLTLMIIRNKLDIILEIYTLLITSTHNMAKYDNMTKLYNLATESLSLHTIYKG